MPIVTPENLEDGQCVASQGAAGFSEMWFSDWFIKQKFFNAPKVDYQVETTPDGQTLVRQKWKDGRVRVWILTGYQHYHDGSWLGVWPD